MAYGVMVYGVWCMVHDAIVYGVMAYGVMVEWCMVYDV